MARPSTRSPCGARPPPPARESMRRASRWMASRSPTARWRSSTIGPSTGYWWRFPKAPEPERVLAREFRAEEEDLRRVIHPKQQRDDGAGRAEARGHGAAPQVEPDDGFPEREEDGREGGADPDVAPRERCFGEHLVDHGEERCDGRERDRRGRHREDPVGAAPDAARVALEHGEGRAHHEGDEQ